MGHSKQSRRNSKRELILLYTKPFTKHLPTLVATNDKRYIPSGKPSVSDDCSHEYCLAERARAFMDSDEPQKPVGLPWSSGKLKYLPGHVKIKFPLRKNEKNFAEKSKKSIATSYQTIADTDKINKPEMCGAIDEILFAYKIFMLAGMIISEAKKLNESKEEDDSVDDLL